MSKPLAHSDLYTPTCMNLHGPAIDSNFLLGFFPVVNQRLIAVMTSLAKSLQVVLVAKKNDISTVRLDVVGDGSHSPLTHDADRVLG